jgi:hypothetical protein
MARTGNAAWMQMRYRAAQSLNLTQRIRSLLKSDWNNRHVCDVDTYQRHMDCCSAPAGATCPPHILTHVYIDMVHFQTDPDKYKPIVVSKVAAQLTNVQTCDSNHVCEANPTAMDIRAKVLAAAALISRVSRGVSSRATCHRAQQIRHMHQGSACQTPRDVHICVI